MLTDLDKMIEWMIERYHSNDVLRGAYAADIITTYLSIIRNILDHKKDGDAVLDIMYHTKSYVNQTIFSKKRNISDLKRDALDDEKLLCKNAEVKEAIKNKIKRIESQIQELELLKNAFPEMFK